MPNASPSHRTARLSRLALAALAVLLAGALLSACGGSSPGKNAAASEQAQEREAEKKIANFTKCLREHGVQAETSVGPNGGRGLKVEGGKASPQTMEAAQKACARYRPEPKKVNLSPQQKVEQEEAVQKFARCMREHGIKVEASAKGGGIQIGIHAHPGSGEPNPESPGFQRAQESCQKLLPKPPGGKEGQRLGAPVKSSSQSPTAGGGASLSLAGGG